MAVSNSTGRKAKSRAPNVARDDVEAIELATPQSHEDTAQPVVPRRRAYTRAAAYELEALGEALTGAHATADDRDDSTHDWLMWTLLQRLHGVREAVSLLSHGDGDLAPEDAEFIHGRLYFADLCCGAQEVTNG